jgi:hypothetical protein
MAESQGREKVTSASNDEIVICECGGKTWYLNMTGEVECRSCGGISGRIQWSIRLSE